VDHRLCTNLEDDSTFSSPRRLQLAEAAVVVAPTPASRRPLDPSGSWRTRCHGTELRTDREPILHADRIEGYFGCAGRLKISGKVPGPCVQLAAVERQPFDMPTVHPVILVASAFRRKHQEPLKGSAHQHGHADGQASGLIFAQR
jgi:hypothetical protein